jgi:hypothetical protein
MVEGLTFTQQPNPWVAVEVGDPTNVVATLSRTTAERSSDLERSFGQAAQADPITSSLHTHMDPGDSSGEAIPVPIPNTEVKLSSAEDTQGAAPRENRSSPGSFALCLVAAQQGANGSSGRVRAWPGTACTTPGADRAAHRR